MKATKTFKKTFQKDIRDRLQTNFGDLQPLMGKNAFKRSLKKASRLLVAGLKKTEISQKEDKSTIDSQPQAQ